jgi:hypothetical protein
MAAERLREKREKDVGPAVAGALLLVRVWLADRPGALGQVASRIGAIRGDIIGVDVLERSESVAIDEFAVALPDQELIPLLVREIEEVDGASVEEWRLVEQFPDPRLDALVTADAVCRAASRDEALSVLVRQASAEFNLDWAATVDRGEPTAIHGTGVPETTMLAALAAGTTASPLVAAGHAGPHDLAVAPLESSGATLLCGREGHPFRRRERKQLLALAAIADRVIALVER